MERSELRQSKLQTIVVVRQLGRGMLGFVTLWQGKARLGGAVGVSQG